MQNLKTIDITRIAIVAALYVALTVAPGLSVLSYGAIQFRVSEILMLLVFFNPKYSWSMIIGCFISNFFSATLGIPDMIFGTLATAISCYLIYLVSNRNQLVFLVPVFCAVVNGLIVGAELFFISHLPFWATAGSVAIGEFVVVTIGTVIFYLLMKNNNFARLIK
ncbi:QueT transporter family protein [Companilactobacillus mishanensis]|uniref:QueT transporter family protein n=1 Tax=Companilactobacillus mishanensis TaxID=2486008 RepID=A0ABW9PA74_9LACO|nr:QueT transporter family protein [Companilactobacillus mishanensis]MQS46111.1 QueT transporter family protein [Companilactobacillus mishanensis]MQS90345.1 QueT transporter family protein [Companilactobacillus mishanensis]